MLKRDIKGIFWGVFPFGIQKSENEIRRSVKRGNPYNINVRPPTR